LSKSLKSLKLTSRPNSSPADATAITESGAEVEKRDRKRLSELLVAANDKKPGAAAEMRKFLDIHPYLTEKAEVITSAVENSVIEKVAGSSPGVIELIRSEIKGIRDRLGYEGAPEIERLLIAEIVICWLWVQWYGVIAARNQESMAVGRHWEKQLTCAQKRFLRANETLAKVRKLTERKPSPAAMAYLKVITKD
jgi:hypothetical protein